jgi:hypothetical protein
MFLFDGLGLALCSVSCSACILSLVIGPSGGNEHTPILPEVHGGPQALGQCLGSAECHEMIIVLWNLSSQPQPPQFLKGRRNAGNQREYFHVCKIHFDHGRFPFSFFISFRTPFTFLYEAGWKPFIFFHMLATNGVNVQSDGTNGHAGPALCTTNKFISQSYDFVVGVLVELLGSLWLHASQRILISKSASRSWLWE